MPRLGGLVDEIVELPDGVPLVGMGASRGELQMNRQVATVLYVVAMVAIIVGVDILFFKNRFWERLIVNVGIVAVFAAFYFRFFMRP